MDRQTMEDLRICGNSDEPICFGTGGWRAVIGDGFTRKNIRLLAKALADQMKEEQVAEAGIVIGYDRRFLSKEAVYWVCEVMAAEGIPCLFINRSSPTPLIMYYVEKHGLPYGMMVTASHNPALYNGIKIFTAGGRDADEACTGKLEKKIRQVKEISYIPYEKARECGLVREFNPLNEYLDNILSRIDVLSIRERQLKIVLDPMYGVSENSIKTILSVARCELNVIHGSHDTLFGRRMPAPAESSLTELCTYVREMECDLGIATDGDADRLGVVDDTGHYLSANETLCLLYYYLLKYKKWKGPAVRNVSTTHRLDRIAEAFGEKCYEVPVGFKHVSAKMREVDALIGGESSGGMTVKGHINGKDGIYAAALLTEMVAVSGKRLSELIGAMEQEFGSCCMNEASFRFDPAAKEGLNRLIMEEKRLPAFDLPIRSVSYMDGCKVLFENGGWISARFSGTEPLLRIFCEMDSMQEAQRLTRQFAKFLTL